MLKTHFSQFGEIVDCVVPKDPKTKFAKGFGFVTFTRGKAVDDVMTNRPHKVVYFAIYYLHRSNLNTLQILNMFILIEIRLC